MAQEVPLRRTVDHCNNYQFSDDKSNSRLGEKPFGPQRLTTKPTCSVAAAASRFSHLRLLQTLNSSQPCRGLAAATQVGTQPRLQHFRYVPSPIGRLKPFWKEGWVYGTPSAAGRTTDWPLRVIRQSSLHSRS